MAVAPRENNDTVSALPPDKLAKLATIKEQLAEKAGEHPIVSLALDRLNRAVLRTDLAKNIREIRSEPEFQQLGPLCPALDDLQQVIETKTETALRVTTETVSSLGSGGMDLAGSGVQKGKEAFDALPLSLKPVVVGAAGLGILTFIGKVRSWFGEKGKEAGATIKGWGRQFLKWMLVLASTIGVTQLAYEIGKQGAVKDQSPKTKAPTNEQPATQPTYEPVVPPLVTQNEQPNKTLAA